LEKVPLSPRKTYVDVGAGTGFLSVELAERCGPEATIVAVDPWRAAMDRLAGKLEVRKLRNIRLLVQDAALEMMPPSSVDVVVSNLGINNFEDPARVLENCFRMTKEGGQIILTTNLRGHMAEFYEIFRATLVSLGQDDRINELDEHIAHRSTIKSVSDLTSRAGFIITDTTTSTFKMRFADGSAFLRHSFIRMAFLPAWIRILRPTLLLDTLAALETNLNLSAANEHELALTIPIACLCATKPVAAQI